MEARSKRQEASGEIGIFLTSYFLLLASCLRYTAASMKDACPMDRMLVLTAFADNYVYLYTYAEGRAVVIDPGDPEVVLQALRAQGLELTAALATHHHSDHVAGMPILKQATGCQVIGSDPRIQGMDRVVQGGDRLQFGDRTVSVLASPGHTRTSVCYHLPARREDEVPIVWTGDTLFVGGCGRLFECDAATLWRTLQGLAGLPARTQVCGGHNYAVDNYRFALTLEPANPDIQAALDAAIRADQAARPITSTLEAERRTNVFLRADQPEVARALAMAEAQAPLVFAELRRRKDVF
jgi:hydroxyacylglutathione hydrolase